MKTWKIEVTCPYGKEVFAAYDDTNPIENGNISEDYLYEIYEELWDNYGYIMTDHTDNDPEDIDAYEEEVDQMYEDFMCDTGAYAEEMDWEEIKQYTPNGADPEIIYDKKYDKRNEK